MNSSLYTRETIIETMAKSEWKCSKEDKTVPSARNGDCFLGFS